MRNIFAAALAVGICWLLLVTGVMAPGALWVAVAIFTAFFGLFLADAASATPRTRLVLGVLGSGLFGLGYLWTKGMLALPLSFLYFLCWIVGVTFVTLALMLPSPTSASAPKGYNGEPDEDREARDKGPAGGPHHQRH